MSNVMSLVRDQLGDRELRKLGSIIDADPEQTERAVAASLPVLLGGLARNASASPDGAASLNRALEEDHDGSVLDNLGGLLGVAESVLGGGGGAGGATGGGGGGAFGDGGGLGDLAGALAGALGGQALGDASTSSGSAARALDGAGILGHILGGRRETVERGIGQASGLDTSQIAKLLPLLAPIVMGALGKMKREESLDAGGLASRLENDAREVEGKTGLGDLIGGLLDQDDDGSVLDDLGRLAGDDILGSLLGGR